MPSIKDLKKEINNVLGDIIEAVYIVEASSGKHGSKEGTGIIENAISTFDELIVKVNDKEKRGKAHFKAIRAELEEKARALVDKVNKLG